MMDDFFEWLVSPEGELTERVMFHVMDTLEHCTVDPENRLIVWGDGLRLSIPQTVRRIHIQSQFPISIIDLNVVAWLEMHYEPNDLNEEQMEQFEILICDWTDDHERVQNNSLHSS